MMTIAHCGSAAETAGGMSTAREFAMNRPPRTEDTGEGPGSEPGDGNVVFLRNCNFPPTGPLARPVRDLDRTLTMSALGSPAQKPSQAFTARQEGILDAAEVCFVRGGFHRTTMQDIAREASMSSPNIYRYFVSKEVILVSMAERERRRAMERIARFEEAGDKRASLMNIIAYYHLKITRESAILRVELWSEATRNREIEAILREHHEEGSKWFIGTLAALATSPDCDPVALYGAISSLLKGIIVCKAAYPDFDTGPFLAQVHALLDAGLAGRLSVESRREPTDP